MLRICRSRLNNTRHKPWVKRMRETSEKRVSFPTSTHSSSALHVVMVDEELPYPPTSGKRIRTLNLTLRLARRHRLTYVCHRNADADEARLAADFFAEHGIETVVVNRTVPAKSGPRFYPRLAANLLSPLPYSVATHKSRPCGKPWPTLPANSRVDLWHCEWTPYAETLHGIMHEPARRHGAQRRIGHLAALSRDRKQSAAALVHRPAVAEVSALRAARSRRGRVHHRRQRHGCRALPHGFRCSAASTWSRTASIPRISSRKHAGASRDACCSSAASTGGRTSTA